MLEYISFDNFKCLSNKTFALSKINLFTGYNGRGKSSVMQMLLLLSQSTRKEDVSSLSRLHLNGDLVNLGDFDELIADTNRLDFGVQMKLSSGHNVNLCYKMTDDYKIGELGECFIDDINYFSSISALSGVGLENSKAQQTLLQLPIWLNEQFKAVHYVAADRIGPVKFVEKREIPQVHKVGADGSLTINTIATYRDRISADMVPVDKVSSTYSLQEAVSIWIDYIMNGGDISVGGNDIKKNESTTKKTAVLDLEFGFEDKARKYQSYHVGFGYSYMLPIVVTALIAKEGDIVIVENPEAHLHPEAQTRLTFMLSKLAGRNVQVFIETHSEHVINGVRLAVLKDEYLLTSKDVRIFFFDKDFTKVDLEIKNNGRIENWPNRFFDQYQNELAEILKLGATK